MSVVCCPLSLSRNSATDAADNENSISEFPCNIFFGLLLIITFNLQQDKIPITVNKDGTDFADENKKPSFFKKPGFLKAGHHYAEFFLNHCLTV
ncbi:hypothetical protein QUF80_11155 [Desulfococcaceae bacterium HSG8]|nr:hypothetical protein [Desulfococcaceae bacterium HSG8]